MKMKRLLALSVLVTALSLCSCGASLPLPGEELILSAREQYASLDSARVEVVNDSTGEAEQTFIFKYDEKGVMTYSYTGTGDGISLAQYNNGREQFTNDNGAVTVLDSSDLNFSAYSRDVPYPMAGEGLILFYKKAVVPEKSSIEENGGITEVVHHYDVSKLGQYDGEGELIGFEVTYRFDSEGVLIDLKEQSDVRLDGGEIKHHSYTIYISERDEVERVENVVDISDVSD